MPMGIAVWARKEGFLTESLAAAAEPLWYASFWFLQWQVPLAFRLHQDLQALRPIPISGPAYSRPACAASLALTA